MSSTGRQFLIELLNRGAEHRCGFEIDGCGFWLVVTGKPNNDLLRRAMQSMQELIDAGTGVEDAARRDWQTPIV